MKNLIMIGGVDEAGRGPVIGPMVMALVETDDESQLVDIGVKDSKKLTPERREELRDKIYEVADVYVRRVEPFEIDSFVLKKKGLNVLEAKITAELINKGKSSIIYVDSPDRNVERYKFYINTFLKRNVMIVTSNNAEEKYPVVAAASIVAKVERDRIITRIKDVYGDIGSGYPHDEKSRQFIEMWYRKRNSYPGFVRKSWNTVENITKNVSLTSLDEYL